jgi:hypothetical protein
MPKIFAPIDARMLLLTFVLAPRANEFGQSYLG